MNRTNWARHAASTLAADVATREAALLAEAEAARVRVAESRAAEASRPRLTRADITGARYVRDRHGWHEVVRVNAATVTVKTEWSWTDRIAHDQVIEVRP